MRRRVPANKMFWILLICSFASSRGDAQSREILIDLPGGATLEMIWVEPGTFLMGSCDGEIGRDVNEGPQHEVRISRGFYLSKCEITQKQWEAVMDTRPWEEMIYVRTGTNYPAVSISWDETQEFIATLNAAEDGSPYRLPTEAEWEYACRAGTTTRWSFGDDESLLVEYAWYYDNIWDSGERGVREVGAKKPNPWGLYDMHGNAWEWVQDWHTTIVGIRESGSYPNSLQVDPTGPRSGSHRVKRGGSFYDFARLLRSAFRDGYSSRGKYVNIGIRLLRKEF
jgi:formylglycine-generating enzyme required for sulfatase activity